MQMVTAGSQYDEYEGAFIDDVSYLNKRQNIVRLLCKYMGREVSYGITVMNTKTPPDNPILLNEILELIKKAKEEENNDIINRQFCNFKNYTIYWIFQHTPKDFVELFIDFCIKHALYEPNELLLYMLTYLLGNTESKSGCMQYVYYVIDKHNADINLKNTKGCSFYTYCVVYNQIKYVKKLIKKGIDLNQKVEIYNIHFVSQIVNDYYRESKIQHPLNFASYEMCRLLLNNGTNIKNLEKPITITENQIDKIGLFVGYGVDVTDFIIPNDNSQILKMLYEYGLTYSINSSKDKYDNDPKEIYYIMKDIEMNMKALGKKNVKNETKKQNYKFVFSLIPGIINHIKLKDKSMGPKIMNINFLIKNDGSEKIYKELKENNNQIIDYLGILDEKDMMIKINDYINNIL